MIFLYKIILVYVENIIKGEQNLNEELIFKENVKTIDKYIKSIKKELPICRKGERKYLKLLRSNMYDYAISLGDKAVTASNLDTEFGSPKECASEYVQSLGTDTICTNMNERKYGKYLFIAGLSVIAVFAICISIMLYKEWQISRRSDIASTTIVIQEGVTPDDLSDKSRIDSAEDAQLNNSSETQNNDNNNNTDTEE